LELKVVECKTAISPSRLPGLDWAVNPYRGCAHGCLYCYAQDVTRFRMDTRWGTCVEVKVNLPRLLKKELGRKALGVYGIGTVTDPYQPAEERFGLTRACLGTFKEMGANISILTKSPLILRDLDILKGYEKAEVGVSIGIVNEHMAAVLEPGAPSPRRRFELLRELNAAGVRTYLMAAPIIPGVCDLDADLERLVSFAHDASVGSIMWDSFNPRPLAMKRLKECMPQLPISQETPASRLFRVRSTLLKECDRWGIRLLDAF
jgi:DNA repair photolyase